MRTKAQILKDTVKVTRGLPHWDSTESIHERLTIEVLIDIRDSLENFRKAIMGFIVSPEVLEKTLKDDDQ